MEEKAPSENLNILVVDDEPGMCMAIHRALENHRVLQVDVDAEVGFSIQESDNAEEAIRIIERFPGQTLHPR